MISEYVDRLARELDFDPPLSRSVRRQVEDHLWEAVAADPAGDRQGAERRAVARFGDARAIAAQFVVVSLAARARRAGTAGVCVVAAVFLAMKARLAWYAAIEQSASPLGSLGAFVLSVDRAAFWVAIMTATAAWVYIASRRIPAVLTAEYRLHLRRFSLLCIAAATALTASVIADGVLTSLRVAGAGWSPRLLVPLLSLAVEVACAAALALSIRRTTRRTASAARVIP